MAIVSKHKKSGAVMFVVTALFIAFIFSQSFMRAEASDSESMGVTSVINSWIHSLGINFSFENGFVRKLAHFAEYFVLGVLTVVTSRCYTAKPSKYLFVQMFTCLAVAEADEYIQLSSDGRSGLVADVALDFTGAFCGIVIMLFIYFVFKKNQR